MTLSPEAYDSALERLATFIRQHCLRGAQASDETILNKADTLTFLHLVRETDFGYLLFDEAECRGSIVDGKYEPNAVSILPLNFEGEEFEVMLQRVKNSPDNANYLFYDFTSDGELVDVVRQSRWHTEPHRRDYWPPDLAGIWKKSPLKA